MFDVSVNILNFSSERVNLFCEICNIDCGVVKMVKVSSKVLVFLIKSLNNLFCFSIFVGQVVDLSFVVGKFTFKICNYCRIVFVIPLQSKNGFFKRNTLSSFSLKLSSQLS